MVTTSNTPPTLAGSALRDYQTEAVMDLRETIRAGHRAIVLQAGTGAGKTVIAADIIRSSQSKGMASLFLAHRRELVNQCSDKLSAFDVPHGIIMAGESTLGRHTQVASVQTLASWWSRRGIEPPPAQLVVIDECHRATAPTYRKLIAHYRDKGAVIIGLTATPIRGDGSGLADVFDAMVCCPSLESLTSAGYLVPARFFAPTEPDLSAVRVQRGDYVDSDLAGVMDRPQLVGDVVTHWLRHAADRKTVVFASSVAHSIHLAEEFQKSGVAAAHLDGKTPKDERDSILAALSSGDTQVVCNCEVLTEGWDQPDVSCAVLAKPTKSPVRYLQMVGRVLRRHDGKVDALILDHAGSVHQHGFPAEFADWELTSSPKHPNKTQRKREESDARALTCAVCFATYKGMPECPECGNVPQRRGKGVSHIDGDLGEVRAKGETKPAKHTRETKQAWFSQLRSLASSRGYSTGWVSHKYREKFSVWPVGLSDAHQSPSPEVSQWVKSRQIAYAKRRAA